jgi:hypothetical protein
VSKRSLTRQDVEQVWRGRVEAWRKSGLSQRVFCERNQLALSTFQLWLRRLKSQGSGGLACVEIVPVSLSRIQPLRAQTPPIVVVMGGGQYRLEVADGFHPTTLQEVVRALEGRG